MANQYQVVSVPDSELEVRQYLPSSGDAQKTVLLGHAMFSTFEYFSKPAGRSLVDYLRSLGYRVVVFHLSGYGGSGSRDRAINFDRYVADHEAVINHLMSEGQEVYYVGHSVGGLAGLSAIAKGRFSVKKILLAGPAIWGMTLPSDSSTARSQRRKVWFAKGLSGLTGFLPSKLLGLGNVSAPNGYFSQFHGWNQSGSVTSSDGGHSYQESWGTLESEVLVLAGRNDYKMAPPENIAWVMEQLGEGARLETLDADHFGILYGRRASKEFWPRIHEFLSSEAL